MHGGRGLPPQEGGRRSDRGHRGAGEPVWQVRVSQDHRAAQGAWKGGEPQACREDLETGGAEGAPQTA